jgi:hypothetical protein
LTWTVQVSVVQFISSVSALTAVGGAAGLSGDRHLGSVMMLDLAGLIKWQAAGPVPASKLAWLA